MIRFLSEMENTPGASISLYLPPGLTQAGIEEQIARLGSDLQEAPPDLGKLIFSSKTGGVVFWGEQYKCLILPPFPVADIEVFEGCRTDSLRCLLQQELMVALIIVRLGDYAIGVFQGERLVNSKTGTGLVHSRHKKGGSSQRRFERHREKQMESFFTRVCGHVRAQLEPQSSFLDYIIYGGERNTLLHFRKQCRFLEQFDSRTMEKVLNVRRPRQAEMKESIAQIWASQFIEWNEG